MLLATKCRVELPVCMMVLCLCVGCVCVPVGFWCCWGGVSGRGSEQSANAQTLSLEVFVVLVLDHTLLPGWRFLCLLLLLLQLAQC